MGVITEQFPTIARLADPSRSTVGYQGPDLVREAIECYRALYRADQKAAAVHPAEWVPVGERLPEKEGDYLVFPGLYSDSIAIERWTPSYGCFLMEIEEGKRVTHWQPLPPPPAVDK